MPNETGDAPVASEEPSSRTSINGRQTALGNAFLLLEAMPDTIPAGGQICSAIMATLRDAPGEGLDGFSIEFETNGESLSHEPNPDGPGILSAKLSAMTDLYRNAAVYFYGNRAEEAIIGGIRRFEW